MLLSLLARRTSLRPKALQYFYLAPHNSQVPLQMSQTLLLSHHLVLRGPVSQRQTTPASIAPPITSVAYRFVVLHSPSDSEIEQTEESPSLLSHKAIVVGLASSNQSPRDPFAVLIAEVSFLRTTRSNKVSSSALDFCSPSPTIFWMLEQSLQLRARLLFYCFSSFVVIGVSVEPFQRSNKVSSSTLDFCPTAASLYVQLDTRLPSS